MIYRVAAQLSVQTTEQSPVRDAARCRFALVRRHCTASMPCALSGLTGCDVSVSGVTLDPARRHEEHSAYTASVTSVSKLGNSAVIYTKYTRQQTPALRTHPDHSLALRLRSLGCMLHALAETERLPGTVCLAGGACVR